MNHFVTGVPTLVARLYDLWEKAPGVPLKVRWNFPVVWKDPVVGLMKFDVVVSTANLPDFLSFWDWMPVDASTAAALERLRGEVTARRTGG